MFGAGWTEMIIIGVVALVVIGPKDLPIVMRKVGRVVGTVRRMGTEFQRELNKTTGLDQITDLKRSLTEPLRQTSEEIAREFNKVTATGVEPTGIIKPADPAVESVYDQIAANAGVPATAAEAEVPSSASAPVMKPLAAEPSPAPAEAAPLSPAETAAPVKRRRTAKPKVGGEAVVPKSAPVKTNTAKSRPAKAASAKTTPKAGSRKASATEPAAAVLPLASETDAPSNSAPAVVSSDPAITEPVLSKPRRKAVAARGAKVQSVAGGPVQPPRPARSRAKKA